MRWQIIFVILCAIVGESVGQLRCYACSFSSVDSDQSCLTITNTTHSVECPYQYCTVFRQEFADPVGQIASFMRGCEDEPDYLNHEVVDFHYKTYYRACTSNLCNIGDGIQAVVGGNLSPNQVYEGDNLLVPGTGGGANAVHFSFLVLFSVLVVQYLCLAI